MFTRQLLLGFLLFLLPNCADSDRAPDPRHRVSGSENTPSTSTTPPNPAGNEDGAVSTDQSPEASGGEEASQQQLAPYQSLDELVASPAELLANGFQHAEGPLWHPLGYLLLTDILTAQIIKWTPNHDREIVRHDSGRPIGLTFDKAANLIACERSARRITRTLSTGVTDVLAVTFNGKAFNSPDDCVLDKNGNLYFTDPPYGLAGRPTELGFFGVFRVTGAGEVSLIASDLERPNGIALSPRGHKLYVTDTAHGLLMVYTADALGQFHKGSILANVTLPDGLKVDERGHIYVSSSEGLVIFLPDGQRLGSIVLPEQPTNCNFGGPDFKDLYITTRTGLYRVHLNAAGLAPFSPAQRQ